MKKTLAIALALVCCLGLLAACGEPASDPSEACLLYTSGHRPGDGAARADDVRRRAARGGEVAGELFERGEQGRRCLLYTSP